MILNLCTLETCKNTKIDDSIINIECKNKNLFKKFIMELNGIVSNETNIEIWEGDKKIDVANDCRVVMDYVNPNFFDNRFYKKLYEKIISNIKLCGTADELFISLTKLIKSNIVEVLKDFDFDYETRETIEIREYLKLVDLRIYDGNDILTRILLMIKMNSILNLFKVIVFINLKSIFNAYELKKIYSYAKYYNVNILLLDCSINEKILGYERKIIIDEELYDYYD